MLGRLIWTSGCWYPHPDPVEAGPGKYLVVGADTSLLVAVEADYGGPVDAGRGVRWWDSNAATPIRWTPEAGKYLVGGAGTSLLVAVEADHGGPVDAGRGIRWWNPTQQPRSGLEAGSGKVLGWWKPTQAFSWQWTLITGAQWMLGTAYGSGSHRSGLNFLNRPSSNSTTTGC